MDIIDIMLAKAMTPQGKTDAYVAKANKAAAKASKAAEDAEAAAATLTSAASDLAAAEELIQTLSQVELNSLDTEDVDTEVNKTAFSITGVSTTNNYSQTLSATMPDGTTVKQVQGIAKLYKATGSNEDGGMTQKAITDALSNKADSSALAAKADKTYVDQQIATIPAGSGGNISVITNLGIDNNGKLVIVGSDGNIIAGAVSEEDLVEALIASGGYTARNAVGLEIDYNNKTFKRISR